MLDRFHGRRRRRSNSPEGHWGEDPEGDTSPWRVRLMLGCLLLLIGGGLAVLLRSGDERRVATAEPAAGDDVVRAGLETAEAVARAFLTETDPEKRLLWARNPEQVKQRMAEYPDEARQEAGKLDKALGHQMTEANSVTAFVVEFPTGNLRLLEVVGTADGPRVDWDAYARHGTASWEALWSGKAARAVVRVFCEPATERPEPFADQRKWTCFRLSSPDLPQAALGFAQAGSVREAMMKRVVLGTPKYRQRFTLEIIRHEGKDEPLFEITRCLAVGWVTEETAVEDLWGRQPPQSP